MTCAFCERQVLVTTRHHLIPRKTHSKKKIRKRFSKEERNETVDFCLDCHKTVHKFYGEMELAISFNTLDLLLESPKLNNYKIWIVNQREGIV